MPDQDPENFRDADVIAEPRQSDPVLGAEGHEHGLSEVVVLDDADPSLTAVESYLIERDQRLHDTIRLLQTALTEWSVITDSMTQAKKPGLA